MNDKEKILREYARLCSTNGGCYDCPIRKEIGYNFACNKLIELNPKKAVEVIEKWAKEHPERTFESDFTDKFPKADLTYICVKNVGYIKECPNCREDRTEDIDCDDCWNTLMEDNDGTK